MQSVAESKPVVSYQGPLKVWTAEHEEWCIATTANEAADAYEKAMGFRLGEEGEPTGENVNPATWTEEPPGKVFKYDDDGEVTSRTCAEWAATRPAGYFASANW